MVWATLALIFSSASAFSANSTPGNSPIDRDQEIAKLQIEMDSLHQQEDLLSKTELEGDIYHHGANFLVKGDRLKVEDEVQVKLLPFLNDSRAGHKWVDCQTSHLADCATFEGAMSPEMLKAARRYQELRFYLSVSDTVWNQWSMANREKKQKSDNVQRDLYWDLHEIKRYGDDKIRVQKWAQRSCDSSNGTHRLDEPNGTLADFPVQDQGDLGICYANAATLLLKRATGKNLSFVDAALHYKTETNEVFLAAGKICGAFDAEKRAGGCESKYSFYENPQSPSYLRSSGIEQFSTVISTLRALSPQEESALQKVGGGHKLAELKKLPETGMADQLTRGVRFYFNEHPNSPISRGVFQERISNFLQNTYVPELFLPPADRPAAFDPKIIDQLKKLFPDAPDYVAFLDQPFGQDFNWLYQHDLSNSELKSQYSEFLKARSPAEKLSGVCLGDQPGVLNTLVSLYQDVQAIQTGMADQIMADLMSSDKRQQNAAFQLLLAPECETNRVQIPANASCESSVPPSETNFSESERKNWLTFSVMNEIDAGRPLGIDYCAEVLHSSGNGPVSQDEGCGRHASAVTGYRWNADKNQCEFQIWNSWGAVSGKENWVTPDQMNGALREVAFVKP